MIVVVLLALAAPFWSGANMLAELNHTLHAKFALLEPPPELQRVRGIDFECKYFGHMYSFETMYVDFFKMNPWYRASSEVADFVVVPHCITYIYHLFRYSYGFDTVEKSWEALRIVQDEYLLTASRRRFR